MEFCGQSTFSLQKGRRRFFSVFVKPFSISEYFLVFEFVLLDFEIENKYYIQFIDYDSVSEYLSFILNLDVFWVCEMVDKQALILGYLRLIVC